MNEQVIFTLGQAAKAAGKSKGTISKAIKDGRLSIMSREGGSYQIAASELFRVFPRNGSVNVQNERLETPKNDNLNSVLEVELRVLRERLTDKDDIIRDLRERLDTEGEERRKLTALLTDQRQTENRGFWARLLGR